MKITDSYVENLPQSWYPVFESHNLKKGAHMAIDMFGRKWILFRSACGNKLGFIDRFCPHMGTDLDNGKVKGCQMECPLHHWKFKTDGCTKKDCEFGESKKTLRLPVTEKYGLIFVFLGPSPLFDLPELEGIKNIPVFSKPKHFLLANDYLAVSLNAFDAHHMEYVHHRKVDPDYKIYKNNPFHLGIRFQVHVVTERFFDRCIKAFGFEKSDLQYDMWGDNLTFGRSHTAHTNFLAFLAPSENENECNFYIIAARNIKVRCWYTRIFKRVLMNITIKFGAKFFDPDFPVIKGMRPTKGRLSESKDRGAIVFWEHREKLRRFKDVKHELAWE